MSEQRKCCGTCALWIPYRDPDTKRIHPTERGQCGWDSGIIWPDEWPNAYYIACYVFPTPPAHPKAKSMYAHNGCECPTWKPKPEKGKKHGPDTDPLPL